MNQQVLSFTEGPSNGITSITNFLYDHAKVRELASHMAFVYEYPFSMMDHVVFNKFMKLYPNYIKRSSSKLSRKIMSLLINLKKEN